MIISDPRNPLAKEFATILRDKLPDSFDFGDVIVVIGGDGFMLHSVSEHGPAPIYFGLNAGRVGFLLNDVGSWDPIIDALIGQRWTACQFPLLEGVSQLRGQRGSVHSRAINDIYLERSTGQTAQLSIWVDDNQVADTLVCDGVCFSTALGSTGYNFSAGGPACHPTLPVMTMTPICPHRPHLPPFVLPAEARVRVKVHHPDRRPVRAVADGRSTTDVDSVTLGFGDKTVTLAYLPNHDFTSRVFQKILHP